MRTFCERSLRVALACGFLLGVAFAEPTPELPSTREEVATALAEIQKKYGRDAVKLQSHLLGYALQGGSILEASVGVHGIEQIDGKAYMTVVLETGIVYNSAELTAADCPARIWSDVVDPTMRQFETLEMPADGFLLKVAYQYGAYADRDDVNRRLSEHALSSDVVSFHLLSSDVLDMVNSRIPSSELLRRSAATLNGRHVEIALPAEPSPRPTSDSDLLSPP